MATGVVKKAFGIQLGPQGRDLFEQTRIWASRLGFGLEGGIWASKLGFEPLGWNLSKGKDLSSKAGIWVSRLGFGELGFKVVI